MKKKLKKKTRSKIELSSLSEKELQTLQTKLDREKSKRKNKDIESIKNSEEFKKLKEDYYYFCKPTSIPFKITAHIKGFCNVLLEEDDFIRVEVNIEEESIPGLIDKDNIRELINDNFINPEENTFHNKELLALKKKSDDFWSRLHSHCRKYDSEIIWQLIAGDL